MKKLNELLELVNVWTRGWLIDWFVDLIIDLLIIRQELEFNYFMTYFRNIVFFLYVLFTMFF
jgi:hypothetical protein